MFEFYFKVQNNFVKPIESHSLPNGFFTQKDFKNVIVQQIEKHFPGDSNQTFGYYEKNIEFITHLKSRHILKLLKMLVNGIDTIGNIDENFFDSKYEENRSKPEQNIDIFLHIDTSDLTAYRYLTLENALFRYFL
jgi:hypothetical protein